MQAEIVTIGDEILIGQVVDSNSAYIAVALNAIGVDVRRITSVRDAHADIVSALASAASGADIVITTGGLGPTKDDVTKAALADFTDELATEDAEA